MSDLAIVGCCGARDLEGVRADSARLTKDDWFELRLDRFADPAQADLRALRAAIVQRAIFTLRPRAEGGEFDGDLDARAEIARSAIDAGFDAIDLERDLAPRVNRGKAKRIVSWHGEATGSDVASRVAEAAALDADIVKVAGRSVAPSEALRFVSTAIDAGRTSKRPTVAIAMGEAGRWLRPLAGRFGMPFVYAAIHPSRKTADGQITVAEAKEIHRATAVTHETRVFAVAGEAVRKSFSPRVHNAVFRALGIDATYVDISHGDFESIGAVARALPLAGLSITQPHKAAALVFAEEADPIASQIGAANTLLRRADGSFVATNTDSPGLAAAIDLAQREPELCRALSLDHDRVALTRLALETRLPQRRRRIDTALVYGTGGAARAAAHALREQGIKVSVTGRDLGAALALAIQLGGVEAISEGRAHALNFDLLVKCVPDRDDGELPLDPMDFAPGGFAADVVYQPLETAFLRVARVVERVPVPGLLMFAGQAALQAAEFTQRPVGEILPIVAQTLARN